MRRESLYGTTPSCDDAPCIPHPPERYGGEREVEARGMLGDVPCEAWRLCDILAAFPRIAANDSAHIIVRLTRPFWRGRSPLPANLPLIYLRPYLPSIMSLPPAATDPTPQPPQLPRYTWQSLSPSAQLLYIQSVRDADREIALLNSDVVGFDLEWKPIFRAGQPDNPVALVQIANNHKILLIHVCRMPRTPPSCFLHLRLIIEF